MQLIDERAVFSRPRPLKRGAHGQVVRVNYKLPWRKTKPTTDCVLKFFPASNRLAYDKEVEIYYRLEGNPTPGFEYARPLGYGEWTVAKYIKTIGKGIKPILQETPGATIFVLLLAFVDAASLAEVTPTARIAAAAFKSLGSLHACGIV